MEKRLKNILMIQMLSGNRQVDNTGNHFCYGYNAVFKKSEVLLLENLLLTCYICKLISSKLHYKHTNIIIS